MIRNMQAMAIENRSVCLTWQHPENIFAEPYFDYSVTAMPVNTEDAVKMKAVTVESTDMPMVVVNMSDVGVCEEVIFTVSLDGDCRRNSTTIALPICKHLDVITLEFYDIICKLNFKLIFLVPQCFASEVRAEVTFLGSGELKEVDIHFKVC